MLELGEKGAHQEHQQEHCLSIDVICSKMHHQRQSSSAQKASITTAIFVHSMASDAVDASERQIEAMIKEARSPQHLCRRRADEAEDGVCDGQHRKLRKRRR